MINRKRRLIWISSAFFAVVLIVFLTVVAIFSIGQDNAPGYVLEGVEDGVLDQSPRRWILYYNDTRIGAVEKSLNLGTLIQNLCDEMEDHYTVNGEFYIKNELSSEWLLTKEQYTAAALQAVMEDYVPAVSLSIDNTLIAWAKDDETLVNAVEEFLTALGELEGQQGKAYFRDVALQSGTAYKDALLSNEEIQAVLALCCSENKLSFSVDYEKLTQYLDPAQTPDIEPVFVEEYVEECIEAIPFETVIVADKTLYEGTSEIRVEGSDGVKELTYLVTLENGVEVARTVIYENTTVEPINRVIAEGALPNGSPTGSFIWPTDEGRISSYYGNRTVFGAPDFHSGIDVAVPTGTPLRAGDGGKVIWAGSKGNGYGIYVVIDHGNGIETYYAHMSSVTVKAGDLVNQGDFIGYSGATGRVTGPHVHYEFHVNGSTVNPKNYLPSR